MSPDERLRLRRQPHKEEPGLLSPASIDDDFHSVLAEPVEFHERHDSAATTSTATARSFRDLHRKLAANNANGGALVGSDGEDSEAAVSFSEGRRTPLPPVEDDDDDLNELPGKQAVFYTPEASNSPTRVGFSDKQGVDGDDGHGGSDDRHESGMERVVSPPQAVVSA